MRRILVGVLCCLPLLAYAAANLDAGDTPPDGLGKESRSGEPLSVSGHRGKVLVVSFWASWCGPCLQELPVLEALQQRVSSDRLRIVAINYQEEPELYRKHLKKMQNLKMSLVHDRSGQLAAAFGVESLPHLFMIDHGGRIAHVHNGYEREALRGVVDEINALLRAGDAARRGNANLQAIKP